MNTLFNGQNVSLAECEEGQGGVHAVDHGDLAPAEVVRLSVRHGDLHVVPREGGQGRRRRRLQDNHLYSNDHRRTPSSHANILF